jgi:hypothetical protein
VSHMRERFASALASTPLDQARTLLRVLPRAAMLAGILTAACGDPAAQSSSPEASADDELRRRDAGKGGTARDASVSPTDAAAEGDVSVPTDASSVIDGDAAGQGVPDLGRVGIATYIIGNYSFEVDGTELGRRYDLVTLQEVHDLAPTAAAIRKANPKAITLAYMNINARDYAAAVGTSELRSGGWELTPGDCSGGGFLGSGLCAADIGKTGYKERWADSAIRMLNEAGGAAVWSGVFIDDIRTVPSDPGTLFHGYSSTRDWMDRALTPFLAYVHARLAAAGYTESANMDGSWGQKRAFTDELIPYVRLPLDEFFAAWPNDGCSDNPYYQDSWASYDATARAAHAPVANNLTCKGDLGRTEFDLALAMMASDGHLYLSFEPDNTYTRSTYSDQLMQRAKALGRPIGARTLTGGTWHRDYEHGYVDATPSKRTGGIHP